MKNFTFTFIGLFIFFLLFYVATLINQVELSQHILYANLFLFVGMMFLAGILDGFNPCAFSTLLLWSGYLLTKFGKSMDEKDIEKQRRLILSYALYYSLGIFFVYLLLGLGILQLINITSYSVTTLMKFFGLIVVLVGLMMLKDALFPNEKQWIVMPMFFQNIYQRFKTPTSKLASFFSGVIIGLCTVPCGGAIYLDVLLLIQYEPFVYKYSMLLLYKIGFILPVIILALSLSNKKMLQALSRDFIKNKVAIKKMIAGITILMGLLALYMI